MSRRNQASEPQLESPCAVMKDPACRNEDPSQANNLNISFLKVCPPVKGPGKELLSKTGNLKKIMVLLQAKTTEKPLAPPILMTARAEWGGQEASQEGL